MEDRLINSKKMTPKEDAQRLLDIFTPHAYPFSAGSGYLTGDLDKESQIRHAKEITLLCIDEMARMIPAPNDEWHEERKSYLEEIKIELSNI